MSADLARRIQRAHNRLIPPEAIAKPGGLLGFNAGGDLREVWPAAPPLDPSSCCSCEEHRIAILFPMRTHRVSLDEVRAFLEAFQVGGFPLRSSADLYGSTPRQPIEEALA